MADEQILERILTQLESELQGPRSFTGIGGTTDQRTKVRNLRREWVAAAKWLHDAQKRRAGEVAIETARSLVELARAAYEDARDELKDQFAERRDEAEVARAQISEDLAKTNTDLAKANTDLASKNIRLAGIQAWLAGVIVLATIAQTVFAVLGFFRNEAAVAVRIAETKVAARKEAEAKRDEAVRAARLECKKGQP